MRSGDVCWGGDRRPCEEEHTIDEPTSLPPTRSNAGCITTTDKESVEDPVLWPSGCRCAWWKTSASGSSCWEEEMESTGAPSVGMSELATSWTPSLRLAPVTAPGKVTVLFGRVGDAPATAAAGAQEDRCDGNTYRGSEPLPQREAVGAEEGGKTVAPPALTRALSSWATAVSTRWNKISCLWRQFWKLSKNASKEAEVRAVCKRGMGSAELVVFACAGGLDVIVAAAEEMRVGADGVDASADFER